MNMHQKYFNPQQIETQETIRPNWGLIVLSAGHTIHPPNEQYPDPKHLSGYSFDWHRGKILNGFQLVYIVSGSGTFETGHMEKTSVTPGTAVLLFPGTWHRYKPSNNEGWEEYRVAFNGHFAEYLMSQSCFSYDKSVLRLGFDPEFLNVFIRLIDTIKYKANAFAQMASCLTIQLLGLACSASMPEERLLNHKEYLINNIRYRIHKQWAEDTTMEDIADQHHVSYIWFRKAFKEVVGISPGQYQLNLKIEKACQMLKETNLTITEIVFLTGFVSKHHFSRIFKKKMNLPPSEYREKIKRATSALSA
ncbi:MAG TPA: AraC family transcriptional regulator [Mucilaginibacter sp.]